MSEITTDLYLVTRNETGYWNIPSEVESIECVYLTDANKVVHCAEMIGSYECDPIYTNFNMHDWVSQKERDEIENELSPCQTSDILYLHVKSLRPLMKEALKSSKNISKQHGEYRVYKVKDFSVSEDETYEEVLEEAREFYLCNRHI